MAFIHSMPRVFTGRGPTSKHTKHGMHCPVIPSLHRYARHCCVAPTRPIGVPRDTLPMMTAASSGEKLLQELPDPFYDARGGAVGPDADWEVPKVVGAAKIADARGVDIINLSRSYGMILARQMLRLNVEDLIPECCIDGIHLGWSDADSPMDVAHFETMMQTLLQDSEPGSEMTESDSTSGSTPSTPPVADVSIGEMLALSQMYGFLLGTTLRMSCLELDVDLVGTGFRMACAEPDLPLPLEEEDYDRMFMELQQISAALMHDCNKGSSDQFFQMARRAPDMVRINEAGNVIYLQGRKEAPRDQPSATIDDTVVVVIAGRLLDGRAFLLPTYSDGVDNEADSVSIPLAGVPESFALGFLGMRVGEVRTLYIHPSETDGISALFSAQPFPPQTVIIFDIKLISISRTKVST